MFIEKLWEQNPELLTKTVKKIFNVREDRGDSLKFKKFEDGALSFTKYGHDCHSIDLSDFRATTRGLSAKLDTQYNLQWIKFMHKVYGAPYAFQFISYRNKELDKFMAECEYNYNKQTKKVLVELGFEQYRDEQNQTK